MGKTAIILGATGLTGKHLLDILLSDSFYDKVIIFGRRSLNLTHPKLEEHIIDLFKLDKQANIFKADVVFCCIGTTKAKTPDMELYKAIDYGIPVSAAVLCKRNNISCFIVMSSLGANKNSNLFYNRIKGEMEADVLVQNIPETYILRPSLIMGDRNEKRKGESVAKFFMKLIEPLFVRKLRAYKPITSKTIAIAMAVLPRENVKKSIIPSQEIKEIATYAN